MKVIITGASAGIGAGIARVLAGEGFSLGLLARSGDKLRALCEEFDRNQPDGYAVHASAACDLRDPQATETALHALIDRLDGVDALINNAGVVIRKDVWELTLDEWRTLVETNLCGLFYATRAVLPTMREQRRGHLINVSSISGRMPLPGGSAYAATKYAVAGFTESLFQEVRDFGIKATVLFPGSVDSASHRHDPAADHSWKVKPEEVGLACLDALNTAPGTCISRIEIRPLGRGPG